MGALATRIVAPKSRLTTQVDRLVARGLIRRERHPTDNRGVEAVLTGAGMTLLRGVAAGHLRTVREHLVDVLDDEQLQALGQIMRQIAQAAEQG